MPFQAQELDVEKELTSLIAKVQKGHLIELQEICGDWGPLDRKDGVTGTTAVGCLKTTVGPVSFGAILGCFRCDRFTQHTGHIQAAILWAVQPWELSV